MKREEAMECDSPILYFVLGGGGGGGCPPSDSYITFSTPMSDAVYMANHCLLLHITVEIEAACLVYDAKQNIL